ADRATEDRDEAERQDRPDRHAGPRHEAEQAVIEEEIQREGDQSDNARDEPLMKRFLPERRADGLDLGLRELDRERTGVQHRREVLRALLGDAPRDLTVAARD